jgi:hypothetical protein
MARVEAYKTESVKVKLLDELRAGKTRHEAAGSVMTPLKTFESWLANDEYLCREVEAAEEFGRTSKSVLTEAHTATDKRTPDRWKRLREEAAKLAPGIAGIILYIEGILATKGQPPMSNWWRQTILAFIDSGKRWCLLLVGRGGGKSTQLERFAMELSIFMERKSPPGQTWSWLFLSIIKSDARKRLNEIAALLDAIGVSYTTSAPDGVPTLSFEDANGNSVSLLSIAASIAATSGPTALGCTCDEEEKWKDDDGANPAKEVLASIRQTFRTRPDVRGFRCSSKFDDTNLHFRDVEKGDTAGHFIARLGPVGLPLALDGFEIAARFEDAMGRDANAGKLRDYARTLTEQTSAIPAWTANPSLDIEQSRIDEPDFDTWMREVASHGDGGTVVGNMFPEGHLERTFVVPRIVSTDFDGRFAGMDTGSNENPCTLAIVERHIRTVRLGSTTERRYQWQPHLLREWHPPKGLSLDLQGAVLPEIAALILQNRCIPAWWTDGYGGFAIEHVGREKGIQTIYVSTSTAYRDHYEPLRLALTQTPCVVSLDELPGAEEAIAKFKAGHLEHEPSSVAKVIVQLRQAKRETTRDVHRVVLPKIGKEHGDLGVALVRALAHAGVGTMPPAENANRFVAIPDRYSAFRGSGSRSYR